MSVQGLLNRWMAEHDRLVQGKDLASKLRADQLGACIRQLQAEAAPTAAQQAAGKVARPPQQPGRPGASPEGQVMRQARPEPQTAAEVEALRPPKAGE
jgi:hypothetical protein